MGGSAAKELRKKRGVLASGFMAVRVKGTGRVTLMTRSKGGGRLVR